MSSFFSSLRNKKSPIDYLVVGLGNPGIKYENTRHNAGFMAVDFIANQSDVQIDKSKFKSLIANAKIGDKNILLMKPQTFMNLSGEAVVEAMSFYKIPIEKVIIIVDDISLDVGKLRIRRKGSAGGHNGIKSIIALSGKEDFTRVKVGVGKKPNADWDLADWVLSKFREDEQGALSASVKNTYEALTFIVNGQTDKAMNLYNS